MFFLMIRRPPRSTLFPSTTHCRSEEVAQRDDRRVGRAPREDAVRPVAGHPADEQVEHAGEVLRRVVALQPPAQVAVRRDRKSTRLNSSHANISYAVFCLKQKNYVY